jgi:glycosyltransferase involved in cell wall biosynthesis
VTQIGGAETNIIKISKEMSQRGYEVHFAVLDDNGPMFIKCTPHAASLNVIGLFSQEPVESVKRYIRLLKENQFDAVFNFGLRVEIFSRILTKTYSPYTKVISNIRSTNNFRKSYELILDKLTSFLVDTWVSNSVAGKKIYERREKIPASKIEVIYNYIEAVDRSVITQRTIDRNLVRIGILANIKPLKGHDDLIPLIPKLKAKGITPLFICAGADNRKGSFIQKVKGLGLSEYFDFTGYNDDKTAFFDSIDIFLLPSYLEGMPTSILESMAYGKPVISTNIDGIPEQIENGVNGFLVEPGDIDGYTDTISALVEKPGLIEQFVSKSFEIIETRFDKEHKIAEWIKVAGGG